MTGGVGGGRSTSAGFTGVDVVIALAIAALTAALAVPLAAHALDGARTRHAAGYLASELRAVRARASATRRAAAVVFDASNGRWTHRTCVDGNGNGVRRADIASGFDACSAPVSLAARFSGVDIATTADVPGFDGEPGSTDPVRFGSSEMASCSSTGGCTPGTVFVRSATGAQYAVRVGGVTGRTRVLFFEPGAGRWVLE